MLNGYSFLNSYIETNIEVKCQGKLSDNFEKDRYLMFS